MPKFEREVEINAPVETVWNALINPDNWPQWFPGIEGVSNVTSISKGGKFDWTTGANTGHGTIVNFDPLKRLEVLTQVGDDKDSHLFTLKPSGGFLGMNPDECKINYTFDTLMGGGFLGDFLAGGNPKDALKVKNAMNLLRKLVESQ
jgi:uncharacterized protein YndB with AHSA1/START domain